MTDGGECTWVHYYISCGADTEILARPGQDRRGVIGPEAEIRQGFDQCIDRRLVFGPMAPSDTLDPFAVHRSTAFSERTNVAVLASLAEAQKRHLYWLRLSELAVTPVVFYQSEFWCGSSVPQGRVNRSLVQSRCNRLVESAIRSRAVQS